MYIAGKVFAKVFVKLNAFASANADQYFPKVRMTLELTELPAAWSLYSDNFKKNIVSKTRDDKLLL